MRPCRTAVAAAIALTLTGASSVLAGGPYVDATTVGQIQQTLTSRGFRPGPSDGVMGPSTQDALKRFQQSENLEPTGQLNRQTLNALGLRGEAVDDVAYSAATIREAQKILNNRAFRVGAEDGVLNSRTQAAVRDFQASENLEQTGRLNRQTLAALGIEPERTPAVEPRILSARSATTQQAQRQLNDRGFRAGPADGVMGPSTQRALREFQKSEKLEPTGQLNKQTLDALGIEIG